MGIAGARSQGLGRVNDETVLPIDASARHQHSGRPNNADIKTGDATKEIPLIFVQSKTGSASAEIYISDDEGTSASVKGDPPSSR